jgi:hypothetical protein
MSTLTDTLTRATLLLLILAADARLSLAQPAPAALVGTPTNNIGVAAESQGGGVVVSVDWSAAVSSGQRARVTTPRIGARVPVTFHVHHFNFLRYNLHFTVQEDSVPAYRLLDRLWSQFFSLGLGAMGAPAPAATQFDRKLLAWRLELRNSELRLNNFLSGIKNVGLTNAEVASVNSQISPLGENALRDIEQARTEALNAVTTTVELDAYERTEAVHHRIAEKLSSFVSAAQLTVNGTRKPIKPSGSGTILTVTMQPRDFNAADVGKPIVVEYFVQSRLPVQFHAGLAYANIKQVEFEKVRALSGQDLFAEVKDQEGSTGINAYLSYPLFPWRQDSDNSLLATLGTELTSPGKTISVGVSWRILNRLYLTGGVVSAEVTQGGNPVLDQIASETNTRELFDVVTRRRKWGGFGAVSFSVIR